MRGPAVTSGTQERGGGRGLYLEPSEPGPSRSSALGACPASGAPPSGAGPPAALPAAGRCGGPGRPRVAARGGPRVVARGGPPRPQPDLGDRHAKTSAESDAFFQFCGLEPDVLEALGRDNFAAGWDPVALQVRSVSVATSDSESSGHSGEDRGLQAEELAEQVPSTTSVIERNARIIRWLYTCKKARETQGLQGPA
ncbi:PREDICTED: protein FAM110C-like [Galeopterus variegatus]|uniref:Protein FAM110C-like n=1 Tax=Galeopterus variegatus TaxID=482537 RepID=A0ABM0SEI4_GALVR|nr:PREDICTED: protein FAM110C-like [Galeopterus variegatus]